MKFERFLLSLILTTDQRQTIWDSLEESRLNAKKAKDLPKMARVEVLMHGVEMLLDVAPKPIPDELVMMKTKIYETLSLESSEDVEKMLESVYKRGLQEGLSKYDKVKEKVMEINNQNN